MKEMYDKMLLALMGVTIDSVYFKNREGKFLMVSKSKAEKYGITYKEMIGKTDYDFLPEDQAERAHSDDEKVMETGIPIEDKTEEITRPDGSKVYVSVSKMPWKDENGEIIGLIGISRDITQRVEAEKHNFNMVTATAHHMKTPVVVAGGTLNRVINERYGKIESESVKTTLKDLLKRIREFERVINDSLTKFALIIGGKIPEKQELDLREDIIDPILDEFSQELADKKIVIDNCLGSIPAGEIKFEAVKSWIKMSVYELFKNAIKYGGKKEDKIIAFGYEDRPDFLEVIVYDNGQAIPEEHREAIFDKHNRIEENSRETGTGLGLYLVRETIRKHGGNVRYEPTLENHSKFILTIPK